MYTYTPQGVCSKEIDFDLDGGKVTGVRFKGGCSGNLKAIGKLVEGRDVDEVISLLSGNTCGFRPTSCTDQLAQALKAAKKMQAREGKQS